MNHLQLLKISLPPVSYDTEAPNLAAELEAEGNALDAAFLLGETILKAFVPNSGPLLEDWERVYGTPSPCQKSIGLTRSQRVDAVISKINQGGTFTKEKAIQLAATFGYTITITEHRARTYGKAYMGEPYAGVDWNLVWDVNTIDNTIFKRETGSAIGEPYSSWGNEILECLIKPKAQADTLVRFIYSQE